VKDFGTSLSPKSTRLRDSRYCPGRPASVPLRQQALEEHPSVREACVIGVPHSDFGERPLALVSPMGSGATADGVIDSAELREFMLSKLEKWMVPDVEVVAEVEKTTVGKFNKTALREQYRDYHAG